MEPQLPAITAANQRYVESGLQLADAAAPPARKLVIVACMDARLDLFRALGLDIGDAHILRNAGGRLTDDVVRSLVVSTHVLGTREIGVIHHTRCGMQGKTDEEMSNLTGVPGIAYLTFDDLEQSVIDDVSALRGRPDLPSDVVVWGGVYDVDSGEVRIVTAP